MHLGVFTYPGGHHIAGWRHGSVQPREILGYDYYRRTAQAAERGKFDLVFVGDMLAAREKDGRVIAQGALNNIDSISILSAVAGATETRRPGGDALHHLQRALRHRPALRVARPSERRPRRLEHHHHRQRRCSAQLQPQVAHGKDHALPARPGVRRHLQGAVGRLGGRRRHGRPHERDVRRFEQGARARSQGPVLRGEGRARPAALAAGSGRSWCRRAVRRRAWNSPPRWRS